MSITRLHTQAQMNAKDCECVRVREKNRFNFLLNLLNCVMLLFFYFHAPYFNKIFDFLKKNLYSNFLMTVTPRIQNLNPWS